MPWFTIQISYQGEREDIKTLTRTLLRVLGKHTEIFIPCLRAEGPHYTKNFYFMEGYIFVKFEGDPNRLYRVEEDPFFETVVSTTLKGERHPEPVPETVISDIRNQVKAMANPNSIVKGDMVRALDGICRNMEGVVEEVTKQDAMVAFTLYSKVRKERIPLFCLKRVEEVESEQNDEVYLSATSDVD